MERSYVGISLSFKGSRFKFWEILKEMKATSEKEGVKFECGTVTTIEEECVPDGFIAYLDRRGILQYMEEDPHDYR